MSCPRKHILSPALWKNCYDVDIWPWSPRISTPQVFEHPQVSSSYIGVDSIMVSWRAGRHTWAFQPPGLVDLYHYAIQANCSSKRVDFKTHNLQAGFSFNNYRDLSMFVMFCRRMSMAGHAGSAEWMRQCENRPLLEAFAVRGYISLKASLCP